MQFLILILLSVVSTQPIDRGVNLTIYLPSELKTIYARPIFVIAEVTNNTDHELRISRHTPGIRWMYRGKLKDSAPDPSQIRGGAMFFVYSDVDIIGEYPGGIEEWGAWKGPEEYIIPPGTVQLIKVRVSQRALIQGENRCHIAIIGGGGKEIAKSVDFIVHVDANKERDALFNGTK